MLALTLLVTLHMVDGRVVVINPEQVTRLGEARLADDDGKQLHPDVRCVVYLTDGKYVSVVEECAEVRKLMEKP
jgi:hypothetical protein